jgi:hypothetical protein
MQLSFSKINGTNFALNYDDLKDSIIRELAPDCNKAEVLILNNFPVPVLTQATLDFLIFIKIPYNPSKRPSINTAANFVYIRNLIIAVSIVKEYKNLDIELEKNQIEVNDSYINISENASKLKWGLTNYLADACKLIRNKITVHPIFWVINENREEIDENTIIAKSLTFDLIKKCIALNSYLRYSGYSAWDDADYYDSSIRDIFKQASLDSELGYLTKQKVERFQNKFEEASQKAFDSIGKQLVIVKGKAGTGKSSDLLKWMLQKSLTGNRATFLTYNHLLVFDLTTQIKSYENKLDEVKMELKAATTAYTIHQFMYKLARKLAVMLLMSESRIIELTINQDSRYDQIQKYFSKVSLSVENINLYKLKELIQNDSSLTEGLKKEAIDFIKHHDSYKFLPDQSKLKILIAEFKKLKIEKVKEKINSEIFLTDYHKVLERILQALENTESFFKDFNIEDKYELLETTLNLNEENIMLKDGSGKIDLIKLKQRYEKSIKGFKFSRTLYIDEAQDCHPLERDIFFSIFGTKNIVLSSGGKEQLIRYSNVCKWDISKSNNIENYTYSKKRKSFRMKPAVAALANHIAQSFNIDLKIEPLNSDDHGRVIINKNHQKGIDSEIDAISQLLKTGKLMGCTAYESLMILKDEIRNTNASAKVSEVKIDENDVIKYHLKKNKSDWDLLLEADKEIKDVRFWNATGNVDKKTQSVPGSLSVRAIHYESCRGLEAWSIMCFNIDDFFDSKREEDKADNFLLNDIFDQLDSEKRKNMYAATWVLMAVTRAIDTCYLDISDSENILAKVILDFAEKHPQFVEFV